MPKLAKTLLTTGSMRIGKRHTTKRFWYIIGWLIVIIFFKAFWDWRRPESFFTSYYWKSVAGEI